MNRKEKAETLVKFLKERYSARVEKHRKRSVFQTLISCVLSQRTKDQNTARASERLFSVADTPEKIAKLPERELRKLIRVSGPYRQKAKRIREISRIILKKYKGKIPDNREELMELPGVGFKTADITLSYGFGIPTIAVDTHVNRISKRIGFVSSEKNVEDVRKTLESLIPGRDRFVVNIGLVKFGQEICNPIRPKCPECSLTRICDYYKGQHNPF
ncbi:MAG: endonuclease III [Candidatus Aenigmarchaeota archaeon]|nr:endonuclease III [Candidatus Aenigmarchaeota archaeon]NIP40707.1 endonuclease III [Candidatus Aenigmarchaeota archaeon]NIQ18513.1 endonuclease III [Candidatus Aenigmarchaeota archaeon]NIS73412.1 endonuclease III [Candidatus Aenigmarchaeota archaeon]